MKLAAAVSFAICLVFAATLGAEGAAEPDAFWGTEDVAAYLGVPPASVRYWAWQGTGPRSYKIGRRRKYKPSEVKAWAEAKAEKPGQALPQADRRRLSRT
jgi:hypothetical protein